MRKTKTVLLLLAILAFPVKLAFANNCGIKPIPPVGCSSSNAICQCNSSSKCSWVFNCGSDPSVKFPEFKTLDLGKALSDGQEIKRRRLENQKMEQELKLRQKQMDEDPVPQSDGLSTAQISAMAKIMCTNKDIELSDEKRKEICQQYHELEASRLEAERIWQKACAKEPTMKGCEPTN